MKLAEHPRLFIGVNELKRLKEKPKSEFLSMADRWIVRNASAWVKMPPLTFVLDSHNSFLVRAREVQTRVLTLLARWQQTGNPAFRTATIDYIRMIGEWECWSWITWRREDYRPTAIYDLSYGENSATLALAYDLLHGSLSGEEKKLFLTIATRWSLASGKKHCRPGGAWWFKRADSNWNTVCAGGLGMLCLAMYEDLAEARRLLPYVEKSFVPFMKNLDKTAGAWPEGVGYWNYGMRYAFMYLLSRQKATGLQHPLMKLRGTRQTLDFPLDFSPHGQACSFGDVNHWTPLPFHYAVACERKAHSVKQGIDSRLCLDPENVCRGGWAPAVGWRLFHNDKLETARKPAPCGAKIYKGLDWAILANRTPNPNLFMSIRGGTTRVPHGHCDLLSLNVVVGDEKLISNEGNSEYLDTTFSPRRYDLPDINAQYKNTILINGVGVFYGGALNPAQVFNRPGLSGVRMEGASAMGMTRSNEPAARFYGRLVLLLKNKAFLIIDRVKTRFPARIESRLHTHATVHTRPQGPILHGKRETLSLAYAANVPALQADAMTAPTTPSAEPARMLRWCTKALHTDMLLVTLAVPGKRPSQVTIDQTGRIFTITAAIHGRKKKIRISDSLNVLR